MKMSSAHLLFATLFLAAAPLANAQIIFRPLTFTVNSTADTPDAFAGDGICDDGTGHCTLRAAITESNRNLGADTIRFSIPTTDSGYANGQWTIQLTQALADIADPVNITGPGSAKLLIDGGGHRVWNVTTSGTVSISGMTIANGAVFGQGPVFRT